MKIPIVYFMTNKKNRTLYTGEISNLVKRAYKHREGVIDGFAKEQECKNLVYLANAEFVPKAPEKVLEEQMNKLQKLKLRRRDTNLHVLA